MSDRPYRPCPQCTLDSLCHPEHIYAGRCPVGNPCDGMCCEDERCTCVRELDLPNAAPVPLCVCGHVREAHIGAKFRCWACEEDWSKQPEEWRYAHGYEVVCCQDYRPVTPTPSTP